MANSAYSFGGVSGFSGYSGQPYVGFSGFSGNSGYSGIGGIAPNTSVAYFTTSTGTSILSGSTAVAITSAGLLLNGAPAATVGRAVGISIIFG
jgi:hypothetical protein